MKGEINRYGRVFSEFSFVFSEFASEYRWYRFGSFVDLASGAISSSAFAIGSDSSSFSSFILSVFCAISPISPPPPAGTPLLAVGRKNYRKIGGNRLKALFGMMW